MARAAGAEHVYGFGENARSTYRLLDCVLDADHSILTARISGGKPFSGVVADYPTGQKPGRSTRLSVCT